MVFWEYVLIVSTTSSFKQSVIPSVLLSLSLSRPLSLVALVMYWFSARLLPLRAAHCWQCLGLPAGLQSSSTLNRLSGGDQLNPGPFIVWPALLAREKPQHKFTTWLTKFHARDPSRVNRGVRRRKPLHCKIRLKCSWNSFIRFFCILPSLYDILPSWKLHDGSMAGVNSSFAGLG